MTIHNLSLADTIERAKREVLADVAAGDVPATVGSFSEQHDHVDANYYGGAFESDFRPTEELLDFWNAVQNAVDAWIKAGGLEDADPANWRCRSCGGLCKDDSADCGCAS